MSQLSTDVEREHLLDQVFDARTAAEISDARRALRVWITDHPDEPGLADAFEVLSHREDLTNEQQVLSDVKHPAAVR